MPWCVRDPKAGHGREVHDVVGVKPDGGVEVRKLLAVLVEDIRASVVAGENAKAHVEAVAEAADQPIVDEVVDVARKLRRRTCDALGVQRAPETHPIERAVGGFHGHVPAPASHSAPL